MSMKQFLAVMSIVVLVAAPTFARAEGKGQGQGGNAQTTNVDARNDTDVPRQAPPAIAPNLTAVPETCMGSAAVGASTPFGGVSFGSTYKSEDCEVRMYARALMALGQNEAALALLATNAAVAAALKATGYKAAWLHQEKDRASAAAARPIGDGSRFSLATTYGTFRPFDSSP